MYKLVLQNRHCATACILVKRTFRNFSRLFDRDLVKKEWQCTSIRAYVAPVSTEKDNIIVIGSPGSGKTTVGKLLGQKFGLPFYDVDDDVNEPGWGISVADKLTEIGSEKFVEEEGKLLANFDKRKCILSLSGSSPMYAPAMRHIRKTGIVVFLDVSTSDILERLEKMRVNRIIGQNDGVPMAEILKFRQQFYECNYDLRILCERNETPESVADKVFKAVKTLKNDAGYISTRDSNVENTVDRKSFSNVILKGLAPDGGLYVPASDIPVLTNGEWERLVHMEYQDRALRILEKLISPKDLHPSDIHNFVQRAYTQDAFSCNKVFPVQHLEDNQYLLELFHGPTASFKDAALQLMPQFFVEALKQEGLHKNTGYVILVATSGDTGGAVLDGFKRHAEGCGVGVMVLFPEDGISDVQKYQMMSMQGKNVEVIGIKGDFDVCQALVKKAFGDKELSEHLYENMKCKLSAANSISWGRLVPQIVYQVSAYLDLVKMGVISVGDEVDMCIPTGNFGNILAAYYAKTMGIPYRHLICASNSNNALTQFLNSGTYDIRSVKLQKTASPAIDILVSSNLERYLYHTSGRNSSLVRECFESLDKNRCFKVPEQVLDLINDTFVAKWCNEDECKQTIKSTLENTGYLLDPHTAVGKFVGDRANKKDVPMLIASTAHYSKFAPEVLIFLGCEKDIEKKSIPEMYRMITKITKRPHMHFSMEECMKKSLDKGRFLNANYTDVKKEITSFAAQLQKVIN